MSDEKDKGSAALQSFLSVLFIFAVTVLLDIGVKIYGWGLQPKSWGWIIGGGFVGMVFIHFIAGKVTGSRK